MRTWAMCRPTETATGFKFPCPKLARLIAQGLRGLGRHQRNNKVGTRAARNKASVLLPKNSLRSGEWV
jgi:hypothetical protein